jgi:putative aldouronate transport system permease protein
MHAIRKYKFDFLMCALIVLFSLCCLLPMLLIVAVSFTPESVIIRSGYQLIPESLTLKAYETVLKDGGPLLRSYLVTIALTVVGTVLGVMVTAMTGYALSRKHMIGRTALSFYFFFTLMFSGGLVPWYIICGMLGLRDNVWALLIPNLLFNAFNMFLVRNFMAHIPDALMESAKIDGASEYRIAFRIYFPLSMPVLATIALFISMSYWNDWWNAIMLVDDKRLYTTVFLVQAAVGISHVGANDKHGDAQDGKATHRIGQNGHSGDHGGPHHTDVSLLAAVFCQGPGDRIRQRLVS